MIHWRHRVTSDCENDECYKCDSCVGVVVGFVGMVGDLPARPGHRRDRRKLPGHARRPTAEA